jgi:hypothetical protein
MPLESGTTIAQLDPTWPLEGDDVNEGNDHLWLIKQVLQTQFPGALGLGFNIPIVATEDELNYSQGLTGNIQDQLDALAADDDLKAPAGTVMTFYQIAPPSGWTQITSLDDYMMVIVDDGSGGTNAGADSPINPNLSHVHTTASLTLTIAQMPQHDHNVECSVFYNNDMNGGGGAYRSQSGNPTTSKTGGGSSHNHGQTGTGSLTYSPKYANMIIASKD